jgi:monoamine oxidase
MGDEFSRRELLRQALFATAAVSAPALRALPLSARLEPSSPTRKTVVVGAGLAGLAAAYELTRRGHEVTVLEARTRPGGRVYTIREPFSDGLYAEAGAQYIPGVHQITLDYCKEFELDLHPGPARGFALTYYLRGRRLQPDESGNVSWPFELKPEEQGLKTTELLRRYISSAVQELGDMTGPGWPGEELLRFDRMTFSELLRSRGASEGAIEVMRLNYLDQFGDGFDAISALFLLRERTLQTTKAFYTIAGGNDRLAQAFARRLSERIYYGVPVVRIEQTPGSVRTTYLRAGRARTLSAEYLVCAIPFSILRTIEVTPAFSPGKRRTIDELPYTSVSRIFLQSARRFWVEQGLGASAHTDLPVMGIHDATFDQPGVRGILDCYAAGERARRIGALGEEARIAMALRDVELVYPGIGEQFEAGISKCWDEDEWSRGDYCWFKPGQMLALIPHIAHPEGRVYFAGEHASAWPGWMQGALASGQRAAREIDAATS